MPVVNPSVLRWARESAGLSLEEAATKIGLNAAHGMAGGGRLHALETTEGEVSRPVLLKMAKVYRRSLLVFFLDAPPACGHRGEDFRTVRERHTSGEPLVAALVRDIRARQALVRAVREDEDDAQALPFIGSMSPDDGASTVLDSIRRTLALDLNVFRSAGSVEAGFAYLRERVEAAGIYVLLIGNLGSHHSVVDVDAFRGFALADAVAPFVVINDQDAKSAWAFTLLHEVVHLWLGASGVSGQHFEGATEKFCNDVASEFLLPRAELASFSIGSGERTAIALQITEFAQERLLGRSLVAYRLFRAGLLGERLWQEIDEAFAAEWARGRETTREQMRQADGGPNYYVVRRHRLGAALLDLVARSVNEGLLTPTRAGKVLGVKPRNVHTLLSGATSRLVYGV